MARKVLTDALRELEQELVHKRNTQGRIILDVAGKMSSLRTQLNNVENLEWSAEDQNLLEHLEAFVCSLKKTRAISDGIKTLGNTIKDLETEGA